MIARVHRISKAVAVFGASVAVLVVDVAGQVSDVTADGTIVSDEWKLLVFGFFGALVAFFAPKNAEPA